MQPALMGHRVLILFARTGATGLLHVVATAVVARAMGAGALGSIGYLTGLVGLLAIVSDLGYSKAYVRSVAGRDEAAEETGTLAAVKLALSIVLSAAIVALPYLQQSAGVGDVLRSDQFPAFYLVGAFYVLSTLSTVFQRAFGARLEAAKLAVVGVGSTCAGVAIQLLTAWRGWGLTGLGAALAMQGLVALLLGAILYRGGEIGRPSIATLRRFTLYALPQMAIIVFTQVAAPLDRTLLGWLSSVQEVGYYVAVLGVLNAANHMVRAAMALFFARVSADVAADDMVTVGRRLKGALKYMLLPVVALASLTIVLRGPLVRIYLGESFMPAARVAAVFAASVIPGIVARPYRNVLYAIDRHHMLLWVQVLGLTILVAASIVLVPLQIGGLRGAGLGSFGAALATLLKQTSECVAVVALSKKHAKIGAWPGTGWFVLAGAVMVGAGSTPRLLGDGRLSLELLATAVGLLLYVGTLAAAGHLRRAELDVLREVIRPRRLLVYVSTELRGAELDARQGAH